MVERDDELVEAGSIDMGGMQEEEEEEEEEEEGEVFPPPPSPLPPPPPPPPPSPITETANPGGRRADVEVGRCEVDELSIVIEEVLKEEEARFRLGKEEEERLGRNGEDDVCCCRCCCC
jgi:hypothetical protein